MQKPSFWQLFGAYVVDALLPSVVFALLGTILLALGCLPGIFLLFIALFLLPVFLLLALYLSVVEKHLGASLGKGVMGLRVVVGKNSRDSGNFGALLVAYGIDLSGVSLVVAVIVGICSGGGDIGFLSFAAGVLGTIFGSFYFAICESNEGKTLGKKLMKLQVVQTGAPSKQDKSEKLEWYDR